MPATAENLRDLHNLHQRAKALHDRLDSAPRTLTARQALLTSRQASLEAARKTLLETKAHLKSCETQLQGMQGKIDDLKVKLNSIKKQVEYDAIRNQIAHDRASMGKLEDEVLETLGKIDDQTKSISIIEAELATVTSEVALIQREIETKTAAQKAQLDEIETAITEAEAIIPEDARERYRRTVKQHGAEAMAPVEFDRKSQTASCSGCYVSVTTQMMNELINCGHLSFCKTCGRILYLAEEDHQNIRRGGR